MKEKFGKYGYQLNDVEKERFEKYYNLLLFYNSKFNLTAITECEEVIVKHFIDSVIPVDMLIGKRLIDIGSGGGFPALPVKIMREDLAVDMMDATEKKCGFLREVVKELNLKDANVLSGRAEDFAKKEEFREKYDICTSRAVARLNILCEYCLPFVKVGGVFVAYKGDAEEEIKESENAVKILGGKIKEVKEYFLEGAKRTLVFIEKIKSTDKKYPRQNGQIRKNPL